MNCQSLGNTPRLQAKMRQSIFTAVLFPPPKTTCPSICRTQNFRVHPFTAKNDSKFSVSICWIIPYRSHVAERYPYSTRRAPISSLDYHEKNDSNFVFAANYDVSSKNDVSPPKKRRVTAKNDVRCSHIARIRLPSICTTQIFLSPPETMSPSVRSFHPTAPN